MGSSHQNVKQILLKLEKKGFVRIEADRFDKRKQRILLTEACMHFCEENDKASDIVISALFKNIPQEQLLITTQTILQMENNLKEITYEENSHHL
jgi:DNA-binding MarR family transcriptional regulator